MIYSFMWFLFHISKHSSFWVISVYFHTTFRVSPCIKIQIKRRFNTLEDFSMCIAVQVMRRNTPTCHSITSQQKACMTRKLRLIKSKRFYSSKMGFGKLIFRFFISVPNLEPVSFNFPGKRNIVGDVWSTSNVVTCAIIYLFVCSIVTVLLLTTTGMLGLYLID